jgi:hypothetical protein
LKDAFAGKAAPRGPGVRLGRAALYAFGAGTLSIAAVACSSSSTPANADGGESAKDAGQDVFQGIALYGAPAFDAEQDAFQSGPLYGAPAFDAAYGGPPFDAALPPDANEPDEGVTPAYGAPPTNDH